MSIDYYLACEECRVVCPVASTGLGGLRRLPGDDHLPEFIIDHVGHRLVAVDENDDERVKWPHVDEEKTPRPSIRVEEDGARVVVDTVLADRPKQGFFLRDGVTAADFVRAVGEAAQPALFGGEPAPTPEPDRDAGAKRKPPAKRTR